MRLIDRVFVAVLFAAMTETFVFGADLSASDLETFLATKIAAAQTDHKIPAIAALVQIDGKLAAASVAGVRRLGDPTPATLADRWHIGSDTKAMTAAMIARLVEHGAMSFEDTLVACFPALAPRMHSKFKTVTVAQLLSHSAGLASLTEEDELPDFMHVIEGIQDLRQQRAAIARHYLTQAPAVEPGTTFKYSNLGYVIAGAIAEQKTGKSWETLVREEIFAPLGMASAGFGAPGTPGAADQPRGHGGDAAGKLNPFEPNDPNADNPPVIGPAGLINLSLQDWAKFAQDQLDGELGQGKLLKPETYRRLHTPISPNGTYAMGWGVKTADDKSIVLLTHTGSNGNWFADIRIMPKKRMIFLVVTNAGTDSASAALKAIRAALIDHLHPFD